MNVETMSTHSTPRRCVLKYFTLICLCWLLCAMTGGPVFAGPPGWSITDLFVTKQGNGVIYSNGNMQAALTVHYELVDGQDVSNIEFLQLHTRAPVENLGWTPSSDDNGFEHEIYNQRRPSRRRNFKATDNSDYFLTAQNNGTIDVCVRLTTSNGDSTDTCDKTLNNAYVTLQATTPIVYSGGDFELLLKDYYASNYVVTSTWGMYKKTRPFNVHSVSGTIEGTLLEVDTDLSSLMTTDLSGSDGSGVDQGTAYLASSDLETYSYIDETASILTMDMTMVDNPILKVTKQTTFVGMYSSDYHCLAWSDSSTTYDPCVKYSIGDFVDPVPASTIEEHLIEKRSHVIGIVDTYGTEHMVVVKMDSQGDIFIEP